jgi:hypothetical protein
METAFLFVERTLDFLDPSCTVEVRERVGSPAVTGLI